MRVFKYSPVDNYTFGCMLVAAPTKELADLIAGDESANYLSVEFDEEIVGLSYSGSPGVLINCVGEE